MDAALDVFWRLGFQAATLDDICDAAGISKSSLYSVVSSKHELLEKALFRYGETWMLGIMEPVSRPDAAREEIEEATRRLIKRYAGPAGRQGCLALNCVADVGHADRRILEAAKQVRGIFEESLLRAVERGQAQGTISAAEAPKALAGALLTMMNGISVLAKLTPPRSALSDIARVTMKLLD